jgi:hypothetical protein
MADIKIFEMNDCDWMAATTLEEAVEEYKASLDGEFDEADPPRELTAYEMELLRFRETGPDDEPLEKKSFRAKLDEMIAAGESFPCFFASTEF